MLSKLQRPSYRFLSTRFLRTHQSHLDEMGDPLGLVTPGFFSLLGACLENPHAASAQQPLDTTFAEIRRKAANPFIRPTAFKPTPSCPATYRGPHVRAVVRCPGNEGEERRPET